MLLAAHDDLKRAGRLTPDGFAARHAGARKAQLSGWPGWRKGRRERPPTSTRRRDAAD